MGPPAPQAAWLRPSPGFAPSLGRDGESTAHSPAPLPIATRIPTAPPSHGAGAKNTGLLLWKQQ